MINDIRLPRNIIREIASVLRLDCEEVISKIEYSTNHNIIVKSLNASINPGHLLDTQNPQDLERINEFLRTMDESLRDNYEKYLLPNFIEKELVDGMTTLFTKVLDNCKPKIRPFLEYRYKLSKTKTDLYDYHNHFSQTILEACNELYSDNGFSNSTINNMSDLTGMGKLRLAVSLLTPEGRTLVNIHLLGVIQRHKSLRKNSQDFLRITRSTEILEILEKAEEAHSRNLDPRNYFRIVNNAYERMYTLEMQR